MRRRQLSFGAVRGAGTVWFVREGEDSPAPSGADGRRSVPFWSCAACAARAVDMRGRGLWVESMPLDAWCEGVLPAMNRVGLLVASIGPRAASGGVELRRR
ncbi:DUF2750 domain-containing protein [Streptomyces formicae]|uniref:DUF2750 domain-containing protein n=1 Tax=Streptomyces formicae TaxID=1616117 RepID=A0ABY3WKW0_9ACTN|nr:DUF2750 domain-containing protein [Streptomyces formicae]